MSVEARAGEPATFADALVAWRTYRRWLDQCRAENHRLKTLLREMELTCDQAEVRLGDAACGECWSCRVLAELGDRDHRVQGDGTDG